MLRTIVSSLTLLLAGGIASAQTQINPNTDINWSNITNCGFANYAYSPQAKACINTTGTPGGTLAAPTASPVAGTYTGTQTVALTIPSGATGCYTTDGTTAAASTPGTCSHGSTYSTALTVSATTTINALATEVGFTNSTNLVAVYTISAPLGTPTFSPVAGTYTGTQSITITCSGGKTPFYRTDGLSPVTIASTKYTAPVSVANPGGTISAICATLGAWQGNTQASSFGSACHTANGGTFGSITCSSSAGVGTLNPTALTWTFATPSVETLTSPASATSEVQALYTWLYGGNAAPSAPTCDSCTEQVEDVVMQPTAGSSVIANNEMDMPQYDFTHGINRQNGFQCNQQSGKFVWQVDSGKAGGWTDTSVACNLLANTTYEIVKKVSHVIGDTGCGGNGCAHYDWVWVNGTFSALGGTYGNTQGYSSQTGQKAWGRQDQVDLRAVGSITGGRKILSSNVALGFGDESSTASATYVVH